MCIGYFSEITLRDMNAKDMSKYLEKNYYLLVGMDNEDQSKPYRYFYRNCDNTAIVTRFWDDEENKKIELTLIENN